MNESTVSRQFSTRSTVKTVLLTLLLLCPLLTWAQVYKISPDDTGRKTSWLLMRDGTVLRGRVLRQDSITIAVQKRRGEMSFVEADQVVRITAQRPDLPEGTTSISSDGTPRAGSVQTVFVMRDGARVPGTFVKRDSTMITVRKPNGQLTFFEPELLSRVDTVFSGMSSNAVIANQFSPWLLTGLTAFNPEKGRFYYRNTWLLLNEFDYGITRFWSVGGSFVTPFPFPGDDNDNGYAVRYRAEQAKLFTKLSATITPSFRLSVNGMYQRQQRNEFFAANYGTWTFQGLASFGSSQRNVTVGYGIVLPSRSEVTYAGYQPPYSSSRPPIFTYRIPNRQFLTLGIMQKVGRSLTLISDNAINLGNNYDVFVSQRATVSIALRLDRPRHAFDLGLYSLISDRRFFDESSVRLYPYLGYNLLIGK